MTKGALINVGEGMVGPLDADAWCKVTYATCA